MFAAIVLMASLAIVVIALSGMPSWIKFLSGVFACGCTGFASGRYLRPYVRSAVQQPAGHWRVADADDRREFTAELVSGLVRGAWIVLNLGRSDDGRVVLIPRPDSYPSDTRRLLRVRRRRALEP